MGSSDSIELGVSMPIRWGIGDAYGKKEYLSIDDEQHV